MAVASRRWASGLVTAPDRFDLSEPLLTRFRFVSPISAGRRRSFEYLFTRERRLWTRWFHCLTIESGVRVLYP